MERKREIGVRGERVVEEERERERGRDRVEDRERKRGEIERWRGNERERGVRQWER